MIRVEFFERSGEVEGHDGSELLSVVEFETVDDREREASVIACHREELVSLSGNTPLTDILVRDARIEAVGTADHERIEAFFIELFRTVGADYG